MNKPSEALCDFPHKLLLKEVSRMLDTIFIPHKAVKQPHTCKSAAELGFYQGCLTPSSVTHH